MDGPTIMGVLLVGLIIFLIAFDKLKNPNGRQNTRPQGYVLVPREKLSDWTKWQAKERMYLCDENKCSTSKLRTGYQYFEGKNYRYAVYYSGNGSYTVYSQKNGENICGGNRMTTCEYCGEHIQQLPFKCHRCNKTFCTEHRLPENHNCEYKHIVYEKQNPRQRDSPSVEDRIYKSIFSNVDGWRR